MTFSEAQFQIGKAGLTGGIISSLNVLVKSHSRIRISVLKSATRDRAELEKMAEEIKSRVDAKCDYKLIGFTIILIRLKLRK
jgi:RNA-binding protein YhbY